MAFVVLGVGIAFIIFAIVLLKLHPFLALILAAMLVGLLSPRPLKQSEYATEINAAQTELQAQRDRGELSADEYADRVARVGWDVQDQQEKKPRSQWILALELTARGFGETAAGIGIVIALAAVIGQCLLESGAADKITRTFVGVFGTALAGLSLLASGYILSVPVFFDTVFYLLVPLARTLSLRVGGNYLYYVMAICAGGAITHSLVPPTPGPLVMVDHLEKVDPNFDLGTAIGLGFLIGLLPALIGGLGFGWLVDRRLKLPMRDAAGVSREELEAIAGRDDSELPGFLAAVLPVILPVILITGNSIVDLLLKRPPAWLTGRTGALEVVQPYMAFLGNKNFALLLATGLAAWVLIRRRGWTLDELKERLEPAFMSAGIIILITSAGGAFGRMLSRIGLADALGEMTGQSGGFPGYGYILLAWGVAALMKIAQGSGTVAMITAAGIVASVLGSGSELPFHMIYIFSAIGFGSLFISWMNDSGFWVVCKLGGFTERETLASWTVLLAILGVTGLIEVLILIHVLPGV